MSNSYEINGVLITPGAGGYYELTHPSLPDPVRERGKENAEVRALAIAAALSPEDAPIPPQSEFPPAAGAEEPVVRTVETSGEEPPSMIPGGVPREYKGVLDAQQRKVLGKMGVKTRRIVLEENSDIPPTGLYLGHNGRGYMIVPGEPVDVPEFLLGVLNDAVMSAPVVDRKTQKVLGYRNRMRYPYRYVE